MTNLQVHEDIDHEFPSFFLDKLSRSIKFSLHEYSFLPPLMSGRVQPVTGDENTTTTQPISSPYVKINCLQDSKVKLKTLFYF